MPLNVAAEAEIHKDFLYDSASTDHSQRGIPGLGVLGTKSILEPGNFSLCFDI